MRNVYSIILASVLLFSFNVQAEQTAAGVATDFPPMMVLAPEACDENVSSLIVGLRSCQKEPILRFMTHTKLYDVKYVDWFGFKPEKELSESSSVSVLKVLAIGNDYVSYIITSLALLLSLFILLVRSGKIEFKGIWAEASAKQVWNNLYNLIFIFTYRPLSAIQTAFWLAMSVAFLSLFGWLTYNKPQSEYLAEEAEAMEAGERFATTLLNAARKMEDTKVAQLNIAFDHYINERDVSVAEVIEKFNENFKYSIRGSKINKSNWDATTSISNMYNSYEFMNKIEIVKKPTKQPEIFGHTPINPVSSYHSDNSLFKSLESSLTESINDGTVLSALSKANKSVAVSVDAKKILPIFEAEIKKAKLNNSYSDNMKFDNVSEIITTFAKQTAKPYIDTINAETTKQADFKFLTAQGMKILTNSALGFNAQTTIGNWQDYANEIPVLEKTLACSKNYKKHQSERDAISKLDYNTSTFYNIRNNAYVFTSCVRLDGDKLVVLGFDAEAEPERYLDLMATVEAKKLALKRAAAAIRISFFNASEELINETNNNNDKNNKEKEQIQLAKGLNTGLLGFTKYYASLSSSSLNKGATRDAFLQTSDYVYHGRDDGYIDLEVLFNKPSGNELSEQQKSLLEKYENLYDDSISVNTSLRDYSSIDALESSAQTEEKDIWLWIEKVAIDLRPLKNLIGLNANADLGTGIKECTKGGNCGNARVSLTQSASELSKAASRSAFTVIIVHKGVQIVKSLVDSLVGGEAVGEASNNKSGGFLGKVAGKVATLPIFLLNVLEAALDTAATVAWWILAISFFGDQIPPLLPFFLAAILILRQTGYLTLFNLTAGIHSALSSSDERFSTKNHAINMAVNHARPFIGTILIIVFMMFDMYLPLILNILILGLGEVVYDGTLLGSLSFLVFSILILSSTLGFMAYFVLEGESYIVERLGGDRSVFEGGIATKALVVGKITELTYTVKNKFNEKTNEKLAEIERNKKLKDMKSAREDVLNIKHNAEEK